MNADKFDPRFRQNRSFAMMKHSFARYRQTASLGVLVLALVACSMQQDSSPHPIILKARGGEQVFTTPELAVDALVDANRRDDKAMLLKILGTNAADIISSGDPVADKEGHAKFIAAYDTAHHLEDGDKNSKILVIGQEDWSLPIPLVPTTPNEWQFDTEAGKEEILNRRIGRNELSAIATCRAYVEAQRDYASKFHAPNGKPEYAQRFISRPGKHDGLYWPVKAGAEESPFGPLIANAQIDDTEHDNGHYKHEPHHGYYYKILKQQGSSPVGSAKDYVVNRHMTEGFALLVFPAKYGDSGVMTFIVDQNGIVFERNLGAETATLAPQITQFNPDENWRVVTDQ
jgi:hypothetical protein